MSASLRPFAAAPVLLAVLAACAGCHHSSFTPPVREGPPVLVQQGGEPRLWLLLKREEERTRRFGGGRFAIGKLMTETLSHFELQQHDPATAQRVARKKLLTVKEQNGGRTAQARLLGQAGEVVWAFLHDGPVALSTRDGTPLADRSAIEARNPALRDLVPKALDFYAFDGGLVFTAADGRVVRINAPDYQAEPYTPPNEEFLRQMQSMASRWHGGYHTRDFLTRQVMLEGRWIGLFSAREAADAGEDGFGDKIATGEAESNPDRVFYDTQNARRTFWSARLGKTKEFPEGTHDRLFDVTRITDAPEFLEGGFLIKQGTRKPLRLQEPAGFLILHKTRLGEEGRLAITRLDDSFQTQWSATLPYHDLRNRYESAEHLLLYGTVQETSKGVTGSTEHLVSLNLRDGQLQAWNVPAERRVD